MVLRNRFPMRHLSSVPLAVLLALPAALPARADPLPLAATVSVGRPPRPVPVRAAPEDGAVTVTLGRGRGAEAVTLRLPEPEGATVQQVALAGGGQVALVRLAGRDGRGAVLIGGRARPRILWSGVLDWRGDRGERRRDVIEVGDRTGDGAPDVVVGIVSEAHQICGQEDTLLAPRAVDPASLELRSVQLRRLPEEGAELEVTAQRDSPGPAGAPLLRALHFQRASSAAGAGDDPALLPAPVALSDGAPETVWREGRGGVGRWEFATGRFGAGQHRIRAFALVMPPAGLSPPRRLWLVGDGGARLRVTIPERLAREPGARVWVTPPAPLAWRCVSLVLDEAWPVGADAAAQTVAIAEVDAYTELDFGDGLPRLVEELVADGERGAEAARLLATLGAPAVVAVAAAWETLTVTGRRRALRVLADNAALPEAREALRGAATDADADVRAAALEGLVAAGSASVDALAELASAPGVGDEAALALARLDPEAALPRLLVAAARPGGSELPGLRRALRTAADRAGEGAAEALSAWLEGDPPLAARAAVALALSDRGRMHEAAAAMVRGAATEAERFEDRWRLIGAAARLEPEAETDRWLVGLARDAEEWMLRAAALGALARRGAAEAPAAARRSLEDDYPRVRVAAIEALAQRRGEAVRPLAIAARRDRWPMVRAAAVTALADDPRALPVVRAATEDPNRTVRAAAVTGLRIAGDREAIPRVAARIADAHEFPEVLEAAIEYAVALCATELAGPLAQLLRRGLRPGAWAPDVDVAVQVVPALTILGGEEADEALLRAESAAAPASLRAAAVRARRETRGCE